MPIQTKFKLACAPAAIAIALAATPAFAQDAGDPEGTEESTIVVTGSRIARDPNVSSPSPIVAVTQETFQQSGSTDLVETLREVPALLSSTSSGDTILNGFGVGQSTLDLRGLGAARTLVLVNGRRHVSGVAGAQIVDVNTIPSALIENVEVLTGGASAIYGADAVTGVVNFQLRDDFEGLSIGAQTGLSDEGDGFSFDADLTWGTNFADGRGNLTLSGTFGRQEQVDFGDRSFSRNNGVADDLPNPARTFQRGDINPSTMPNFAALYSSDNINGGGGGFGVLYPYGYRIPSDVDAFNEAYTTVLGGTAPTLTAAELALIDQAANSPTRLIARQPTFSISSGLGLIFPASFVGGDINNNGTDDCLESFIGSQALDFYAGCYTVDPDGTVRIFEDGLIAGGRNVTTPSFNSANFNQFGGDGIGNNFDVNTLIPQSERFTANMLFNYEFSEAARFFFEGKYAESSANNNSQPNTFYDLLFIAPDNPYIPDILQPVSDGAGLFVSRDPIDLGPNQTRSEYETWRFVAGVGGDIASNLSYEVSVNWGRSNQTVISGNSVILDRWFAAIDAVDEGEFLTGTPNGNIVCRSDLDPAAPPTTPFNIPAFDPGFFTFNPGDGQCRPANILGGLDSVSGNGISQEAIDFITTQTVTESELEQLVVNAVLVGDTGQFFTLPGGPVSFAVGAEYRDEQSQTVYDPLALGIIPVTTPDATAGDLLRDLGLSQSSLIFDPETVLNNDGGGFDLYEVFGEIRVPVLSGTPFFEELEFGAAGRLSDYSTVGRTFTWNVTGLWAPVEDIRFRAAYSQAARAPNVNELFNPGTGATFRPFDPCDVDQVSVATDPALREANCLADLGAAIATDGMGNYTFTDPLTARFSGLISGNENLREEKATTYTLGVVVAPNFVPNLVASVDYYNIEIDDAIGLVSAQDIVDFCYDSSSLDNDFCPLFTRRDDNGGLNFLRQTFLNFASIETAGIDFALSYSRRVGPIDLGLRANATWVDKLDRFTDPTDPTIIDPELGEIQRPEWAGRSTVTLGYGDFQLGYTLQYVGEQGLRAVEVETAAAEFGPAGFVSETFIHDLSFRYDINEATQLFGGISNFTDEEPFITEQAYPVSGIGRYFFLGVNAEL